MNLIEHMIGQATEDLLRHMWLVNGPIVPTRILIAAYCVAFAYEAEIAGVNK